jgi:hypothetical protein
VPEENVTDRAGVLFWYNFIVDLKPLSSGAATMQCPVRKDITVLDMQSHMHKRGVDYVASQIDGKRGAMMRELYRNVEWEDVPVAQFNDGDMKFSAGDWLEWTCGYDNAEERRINQGAKTTDEMCMLIASFYPYDEDVEFCSNDGGLANWMSASEATGAGTTSCEDTLTCIIAADGLLNPAYQQCVMESCPAVGQEVTDVVKCHATDGNGANCGGDLACLLDACSVEIDACNAAVCD